MYTRLFDNGPMDVNQYELCTQTTPGAIWFLKDNSRYNSIQETVQETRWSTNCCQTTQQKCLALLRVPKWIGETNCWSHWLHTTQPTPAPVAYVSTDPLPTVCKLLAANKSYLHPFSHYSSRKRKRMECQIHQRRAHAGTFWLFIVLSLHCYLSLKCQYVIWFFATLWNDHNMNFCFKLHQSNFVPSRLNKMKPW